MVSLPHQPIKGRAQFIEQVEPPRSPKETLPTMYDLPSEDPEEPGLPDEFHDLQPQLLTRTLRFNSLTCENYFTASDLNVYYDVHHSLWHKRPDWFLSVNVPRLYEGRELRRSYVIWQEGKSPYVVVEFLSPGTEAEDLGRFYEEKSKISATQAIELVVNTTDNNVVEAEVKDKPPNKLEVYEAYLRVPHYIVYSRYTQKVRYFKLNGGQYQEQAIAQENPLIWLPDLEIGLGIWQGEFGDVSAPWLRWCDQAGHWFPTDTEQERLTREQAEQQLVQERLTREQAEQQLAQERLTREQAEQQLAQERLTREQAEQQLAQERQAKAQFQAQLLQAAQNLLATGISIEQVTTILSLSNEQVQILRQSN